MSKFETKLKPGKVYHIWAHAINNENLFLHDDNYHFFLSRYEYYIHSISKTYAYCLLPNHLHLMVELKPLLILQKLITRNFSHKGSVTYSTVMQNPLIMCMTEKAHYSCDHLIVPKLLKTNTLLH